MLFWISTLLSPALLLISNTLQFTVHLIATVLSSEVVTIVYKVFTKLSPDKQPNTIKKPSPKKPSLDNPSYSL